MPLLTQDERNLLGPLINPFGRNQRKPAEERMLKVGESDRSAFETLIHSGENNGNPKQFEQITVDEIEILRNRSGKYPEKCFLWVIDDETIKIIKERNRNVLRTHKPEYVCHTNLTGGGQAYIGGEIYFCVDGTKYISPSSDRYGDPSPEQWEAAKLYFIKVGYTPLIDIIEFFTSNHI